VCDQTTLSHFWPHEFSAQRSALDYQRQDAAPSLPFCKVETCGNWADSAPRLPGEHVNCKVQSVADPRYEAAVIPHPWMGVVVAR
jgi:hypothetical protein